MYVLHVMSGEELSIAEALRDMDYNAIVPEEECIVRRAGEHMRVMTVLMPGYVFLSVPRMDEATYYDACGITGVIRMLNYGTPMCQDDVDTVYRLAGLKSALMVKRHEDGSYTILDGPFAGQESYLVKVDKRQHRAILRVSLCGRPVDIQVSAVLIAE